MEQQKTIFPAMFFSRKPIRIQRFSESHVTKPSVLLVVGDFKEKEAVKHEIAGSNLLGYVVGAHIAGK